MAAKQYVINIKSSIAALNSNLIKHKEYRQMLYRQIPSYTQIFAKSLNSYQDILRFSAALLPANRLAVIANIDRFPL